VEHVGEPGLRSGEGDGGGDIEGWVRGEKEGEKQCETIKAEESIPNRMHTSKKTSIPSSRRPT
jgi:hypothetical protein